MRQPRTEPQVDWQPYPQAETWRAFYQRVAACMERLTSDPTPLLLITHGGTIMQIVAWWLHLDMDQLSQVSFFVEPASLSVLTVNRWNDRTLERLNDTAHLQALGLSQSILTEE